MRIPFAKVPLAGNEAKYIKEVLKSGWLTTSSKALQFENLFAKFIGVRHACAVNSCTAALHLAVEALNICAGDKVLVPTLTFTASAEILRYMGADPIFLDVEYGTGLISPTILKQALLSNKHVKALILVHYAGQASCMTTFDEQGIIDICSKNNILIIEDAAHAFPSKFNGRYIGSYGNITCFSFYANKTITTGEGGMLVTDDENIYKRVKTMRLHGINRDIWDRFTSKNASWEYDVVAPGYKYNMPDLNAAIGLAQLERAEHFRVQRQNCATYYYTELSGMNVLDLPQCITSMESHSWHLFPIIIKPEANISRNEFIRFMSEKGIGTSVHYKPLHRMSYYNSTYNLNSLDYPNAERIWNGTVSLPIYPGLSEKNLSYICTTIKKILNQK